MKTIEQTLELIKLNAYSGTPENIQAIIELVNEAQSKALLLHDVSKSCPCCDGTGYCEGEHYDDLQACLTCGGSGRVC